MNRGLVTCKRSKIVFAASAACVNIDQAEFQQRLKMITNRRRKVPVPRRLIRLMAKQGRRVLIATLLGHLLRLMYLRNGACRADGNCKSGWLANVFGIDTRSVKDGRKKLVTLGILTRQPMAQWYTNRYGWRGSFNLSWQLVDKSKSVKPSIGAKRSLPETDRDTKRPPPIENQYLSSRKRNKKPLRGHIGSRKRTLGRISRRELHDSEALTAIFSRARQQGLVEAGDRLNVFAAAEHAKRVGTRNPPGLFAWLVVNRKWDYVTIVDEEAALSRSRREPVLKKVEDGTTQSVAALVSPCLEQLMGCR